ncbi:MAG TPA: class I SAM-dependent methyltransferase [Aggregatilineales bacterium]|nr:class I SAM-dependent methyltransferase [Anaerolineales bacterium]HRE48715.1 class I SAM-dependent methyltransferase [Aggregatilineales bacterium]
MTLSPDDSDSDPLPMTQADTNAFYDAIAGDYTYFYRDWQATLEREGGALRRIFREKGGAGGIKTVLDASCGVGTQAIPLARFDFEVTAADPSPKMLAKARENAAAFGVLDDITFLTADFLSLPTKLVSGFDAVITKGNALPHLISDAEILAALRGFYSLLRPGGIVLIGMRDFDILLEDRPRFIPRHVHDEAAREVILFDLWDWRDTDPITVTFNTFIVSGKGDQWSVTRHPVLYRALRRAELEALLAEAGFADIQTQTQTWELVITGRKPE